MILNTDITYSLRPSGGRGPRLTFKVNSSFRADRGLPIIQTAQNHTLIQNNMLHPSKYYQMHPQLTARTPRGPPGTPRGPQGPQKKVKKSSKIVNDIQLNSVFGGPWGPLGGPGASWQLLRVHLVMFQRV